MYKIYCDGRVIYDPASPKLTLLSATCTMGLNLAGNMVFRIAHTHPFYNNIHKRRSVINLYNDDVWLFSGTVTGDVSDNDNIKTVTVEGELAYLNDSIQPFAEYHNLTVEQYFTKLINYHNSQVDAFKQFVVGLVTVTDSNDNLYRQSNYEKTKATISDKLINRLGGYIRTRHVGNTRYVDYIKEYQRINTQGVEFGKNLIDFARTIKSDNVANVIIPLGAKKTNAAGTQTEERLTMASVNGGVIYVEDAASIAQYGRIVDKIICDDVTLPENLIKRGYTELAARKYLSSTIKLTALDFNLLDGNFEAILVGDLLPVKSVPHNIDDFIAVTQINIDITSPDKSTITLDKATVTLTDSTLHADKVINTIKADYVKNEQLTENIEKVNQSIENNTSLIDQKANQVLIEVDKKYVTNDTFEQKSAEFEAKADGIGVTVTEISGTVDNINSDITGIKDTTKKVEKHFDFSVNGLTIKPSENAKNEMNLDENSIDFKVNGRIETTLGVEGMEIERAIIRESLKINGYMIMPRENGNVSFIWDE